VKDENEGRRKREGERGLWYNSVIILSSQCYSKHKETVW